MTRGYMTNTHAEKKAAVNLTHQPEIVTFQPVTFLYLEKTGPFMKTAPAAWNEIKTLIKDKVAQEHIEAGATLTRIDTTKQGDAAFILQAGFLLKSNPTAAPAGLRLRTMQSGKYASFILTGSYMQLPNAYPLAFERMEKAGISIREEFCIEKYLNEYGVTPENELKTEILIPIL